MSDGTLLTTVQVADELGVHPKTVIIYIDEGLLEYVDLSSRKTGPQRDGRSPRRVLRVRRDQLDAFIARRSSDAAVG